jgi:hypothetical protein
VHSTILLCSVLHYLSFFLFFFRILLSGHCAFIPFMRTDLLCFHSNILSSIKKFGCLLIFVCFFLFLCVYFRGISFPCWSFVKIGIFIGYCCRVLGIRLCYSLICQFIYIGSLIIYCIPTIWTYEDIIQLFIPLPLHVVVSFLYF